MSAGYAAPPGREVNANALVRSSFVVHPVKSNSSVGQSKPSCRVRTLLRPLFDGRRKWFATLPAWVQSPFDRARARKRRTTDGLSRPENQSTGGYRKFST